MAPTGQIVIGQDSICACSKSLDDLLRWILLAVGGGLALSFDRLDRRGLVFLAMRCAVYIDSRESG